MSINNGKRTIWKYPTKENGKNTRLYRIWNNIQQRCFNSKNKEFKRFSKLGICKEWESFDNFYEWSFKNGYNDNLILNRVVKSVGYFSYNCVWVSKEKETYNKDKKSKWKNVVCENGKCTRLYLIWKSMLARTTNPNNKDYPHYSKFGICDEWKDYDIFYEWAINNGYNDNLTIDRIDNLKGYYPNNCQFIPFKENASKQSKTIIIEGKTLKNISEEFNISKNILYYRYRNGARTIRELLEKEVEE